MSTWEKLVVCYMCTVKTRCAAIRRFTEVQTSLATTGLNPLMRLLRGLSGVNIVQILLS